MYKKLVGTGLIISTLSLGSLAFDQDGTTVPPVTTTPPATDTVVTTPPTDTGTTPTPDTEITCDGTKFIAAGMQTAVKHRDDLLMTSYEMYAAAIKAALTARETASVAAWGKATKDRRLVHARNLDWNINAGIQNYAVVFVVRPQGKHAFVNVAWAGFIGVLTGINDQQLSIGQVGAETRDVTLRGEPMTFLMRRVMEQAETLEQAAEIIGSARRTVGVNYVIADAGNRRGIAVETTHSYARVFTDDDPAEHGVPYAKPIKDAVLRADTAMDPRIRDQQTASHGNPAQPGLEAPGGSAYEVRYLKSAAEISQRYGAIDPEVARHIARSVAPPSNVQSVVFAWPELWVANAQGLVPAAKTDYVRLDLEALLRH